MPRIDFIDTLRAVAILGVFVVHSGIERAFPAALSRLFGSGARGVQLLFVLSAFALMHSWRSREPDLAAFYIRRFFRIFPIYYLVIVLSLLTRDLGGRRRRGLASRARDAVARRDDRDRVGDLLGGRETLDRLGREDRACA